MKRTALIAALAVFAGVVQSNAVQTVRELWDNVPAGQLKGVTNGTTSLGFYPSAGVKWVVNPADPAATNVMLIDSANDAMDWQLGLFDILPPSAGDPGTMALVGNNTNGWDSGSWAVRMLASTAQINFSSNSTNYFSARLLKRGLWWYNEPAASNTNNYGPDDAALGLGFASGSTTNARFVGAGFTRSIAVNGGGGYLSQNGITDIGDTLYVTTGTLGQSGYDNHPADSGGPYFARAYATNFLNGVTGYLSSYPYMNDLYVNGGLVVGRIITSTSGNSEFAARVYVAAETMPVDESTVIWDVSYNFTETANMTYLLVWMHGNNNGNPCWLDAIRVAKTWAEAVGAEIVGPPTASPTNTVYEGAPVTFSVFANVDPDNAAYQWMKDGTNLPGGTGLGTNYATYVLSSATTNDSGSYSVVYSNYFGVAVTSEVRTLTVLAAIPPYVTLQPAPTTRYVGAPAATFSVVADGARPFTYQWKHVVGGTTNILSDQTNQTLILTNIQTSSAGSYFVTIGNWVGSTNSGSAALTVLVPAPGSYADAVTASAPYAYWRMDETSGTVLYDYWGGYDGAVLDPTNTTLGVAGAACAGFPSPHYAVFIPNNGYQARMNMPALPLFTNKMTFCCWVHCPSPPSVNGLIMSRNTNAYEGNMSGLAFVGLQTNVVGSVTNVYGLLGYQWGSALSYTWNSGLAVPLANWTFVALVLNSNQATMYMGTNNGPLTVASAKLPSAVDASFPGTNNYANSYPLMIGRTGWPWAEEQGNSWANASVNMSDVAVFYSALPASSVTNLYLSALGQAITYTYSAGSLVLYWPTGTLQAAPEVQGVYTNVSGATSPYPVPITEARKFYRVRR